jgi:hypothetical protein
MAGNEDSIALLDLVEQAELDRFTSRELGSWLSQIEECLVREKDEAVKARLRASHTVVGGAYAMHPSVRVAKAEKQLIAIEDRLKEAESRLAEVGNAFFSVRRWATVAFVVAIVATVLVQQEGQDVVQQWLILALALVLGGLWGWIWRYY